MHATDSLVLSLDLAEIPMGSYFCGLLSSNSMQNSEISNIGLSGWTDIGVLLNTV